MCGHADRIWWNLCWDSDILVSELVHVNKMNASNWLKWHQIQPWHWKGAHIPSACLSDDFFLFVLLLTERTSFFYKCRSGSESLDCPSGHVLRGWTWRTVGAGRMDVSGFHYPSLYRGPFISQSATVVCSLRWRWIRSRIELHSLPSITGGRPVERTH